MSEPESLLESYSPLKSCGARMKFAKRNVPQMKRLSRRSAHQGLFIPGRIASESQSRGEMRLGYWNNDPGVYSHNQTRQQFRVSVPPWQRMNRPSPPGAKTLGRLDYGLTIFGGRKKIRLLLKDSISHSIGKVRFNAKSRLGEKAVADGGSRRLCVCLWFRQVGRCA